MRRRSQKLAPQRKAATALRRLSLCAEASVACQSLLHHNGRMKTLATAVFVFLCAITAQAADLTGTWTANVTLDAGSGTATFTFTQKGEALTGTYSGTLGTAKVAGTVKGDQIEFSFDSEQAGKIAYHGTMDGATKFKGTCEYGLLGTGNFTAEKK